METRALGADFGVGIGERWFKDYRAGAVYEYGYVSVSADDMLEFAAAVRPAADPRRPRFAAGGPYGGLIGSGWHSGALAMRLLADHYLSRVASLGSPGVDDCAGRSRSAPATPPAAYDDRRDAPVPLQARPRHLITDVELINQHDGRPITFRAANFLLLRRPT